MTDTQMMVMLATIWVVPHCNKWYAFFVGSIFCIAAAAKGLGWL